LLAKKDFIKIVIIIVCCLRNKILPPLLVTILSHVLSLTHAHVRARARTHTHTEQIWTNSSFDPQCQIKKKPQKCFGYETCEDRHALPTVRSIRAKCTHRTLTATTETVICKNHTSVHNSLSRETKKTC